MSKPYKFSTLNLQHEAYASPGVSECKRRHLNTSPTRGSPLREPPPQRTSACGTCPRTAAAWRTFGIPWATQVCRYYNEMNNDTTNNIYMTLSTKNDKDAWSPLLRCLFRLGSPIAFYLCFAQCQGHLDQGRGLRWVLGEPFRMAKSCCSHPALSYPQPGTLNPKQVERLVRV